MLSLRRAKLLPDKPLDHLTIRSSITDEGSMPRHDRKADQGFTLTGGRP